MMKMIALIGQVNAEVTSQSRGQAVSGQVCLMLFSAYTVSVRSQVCLSLYMLGCSTGG